MGQLAVVLWAGLLLAATGLASAQTPPAATQPAAAPTTQVDLANAYTTFGQPVSKVMSAVFDMGGQARLFREPYGHFLDEINREYRSGTSNLFLVAGTDITEVVRASRDMLLGSRSADTLVLPAEGATAWLVCCLGISGSTPPAWTIKGVDLAPGQATVRVAAGQAKTKDRHLYLVFIPLPNVQAGSFTVQLQDAGSHRTTLSRTVDVKVAAPGATQLTPVPPGKLQGHVLPLTPDDAPGWRRSSGSSSRSASVGRDDRRGSVDRGGLAICRSDAGNPHPTAIQEAVKPTTRQPKSNFLSVLSVRASADCSSATRARRRAAGPSTTWPSSVPSATATSPTTTTTGPTVSRAITPGGP